ncbi:MAG: HIT family protein [Clostridia bacterium]|nr:HIT family protein [Clostridia bacterium]
MNKEDCVFCKIVKGSIPSYKIFENESCLAFLDNANDFYAHTLVIPKKHFVNILDVPQKELNDVMTTIKKVSAHYIEKCGFDGVNIFNANGKSAEQSVFHLHFHIVPRKNNDGLKIFPTGEKENYDLNEISEKLRIGQNRN